MQSSCGTVPTELGNLAQLSIFAVATNNMTGPIPSELGRLTSLTYLDLNGNDFNNKIPSEIGLISHLQLFNVSLNQLTGSVPSALGLLSSLCKYLCGCCIFNLQQYLSSFLYGISDHNYCFDCRFWNILLFKQYHRNSSTGALHDRIIDWVLLSIDL